MATYETQISASSEYEFEGRVPGELSGEIQVTSCAYPGKYG